MLLGQHALASGVAGACMETMSERWSRSAQAHRLDAVRAHHELLDEGIVCQHAHAEGTGAHRHGARDVAEGDEAERLPHEARELVEHRPRLPSSGPRGPCRSWTTSRRNVARISIMAWSATSSMKVSGTFVTGIARAVAAATSTESTPTLPRRDHLAPLEPVDHALGDVPALGVERVRVPRRLDELVLRARGISTISAPSEPSASISNSYARSTTPYPPAPGVTILNFATAILLSDGVSRSAPRRLGKTRYKLFLVRKPAPARATRIAA